MVAAVPENKRIFIFAIIQIKKFNPNTAYFYVSVNPYALPKPHMKHTNKPLPWDFWTQVKSDHQLSKGRAPALSKK